MNTHDQINLKAAETYYKATKKIKELQDKADAAKALLLADMDAQGTDEMSLGGYHITRGTTTASVFNSKEFRQAHPRMYEQYRRPQTRHHFHINNKEA